VDETLLDFPLLSILVFLPLAGAGVTVLVGRSPRAARAAALAFSLGTAGFGTLLLLGFLMPQSFVLARPVDTFAAVERAPWVPQLGVQYLLGADELSAVLVFLNVLLTPLALAIGWDEKHRVGAFFALFLFMEATINGVFLSLDLFLFIIFWEVGLVPMYFLIAVWGGPRRSYAAIKFFLYTFLASLPLLVAMFAFVFYGGTFDMITLIRTSPIPVGAIGELMFLGLVVAFGTKLPTWPLHTWLPDAHVEAPTGGSVILAGVLLKLGGYGLVRFNVQMLPDAAATMWWALAVLGIISILYGAMVCLAQDDLKRLVAFSSISHYARRLPRFRLARFKGETHPRGLPFADVLDILGVDGRRLGPRVQLGAHLGLARLHDHGLQPAHDRAGLDFQFRCGRFFLGSRRTGQEQQ